MTSTGVGNYSDLPSSTINYGYNSVGEKVSMSSPVGNFTYGRDAAGRLRSIASSNSGSFNFGYDLAQRLTQIQSPAMTTSFEFDSTGFNTKINYVRGSGATVERFIYGRDHVGNRVSKTTTRGLSQYAYDQNYQLIQAVTPELPAETFSYDSIGNRTSDSDGSYVYDNSKQLIQQDFKYNYVFDLNGNLISKQERNLTGNVQNYEYSSENQLRRFKLYEEGELVKDVTYVYDALGRRMVKDVKDFQNPSKSFFRSYTYDGNEILAEYDETNTVVNAYTHSTLRTDDVLAVTNDNGTFYFVKDALGSITDITNSSGQIVQHHEYSSFGVLKKVTDAAGNDISASPVVDPYFTYTGREYDKETGLYYYRARYYDPAIGRFLQVDSIKGFQKLPLSITNGYIYTFNNPVTLKDPSGKFPWLLFALGFAVSFASNYEAASKSIDENGNRRGNTGAVFWSSLINGALGGFQASLGGLPGAWILAAIPASAVLAAAGNYTNQSFFKGSKPIDWGSIEKTFGGAIIWSTLGVGLIASPIASEIANLEYSFIASVVASRNVENGIPDNNKVDCSDPKYVSLCGSIEYGE